MSVEIITPAVSKQPLKITATPTMPEIKCSARVPGHTGGTVTFKWEVTISWTGTGTSTRGQFKGTSTAKNSEVSTWTVPFGKDFYGGKVTVTVVARTQKGKTDSAKVSPFSIVGTQPAKNQILSAIGTSPWYLQRMAKHESGLTQFKSDGQPLLNTTGDGGVGIFQITGRNQTAQDVWNWKHNIKSGKAVDQRNRTGAQGFWNRQVSQYTAWNAALTAKKKPLVPAPSDEAYTNVTFSYSPTGNKKPFSDAIAIKMFNGAVRHFIVWYNIDNYAAKPEWRFNRTNSKGRNYVQRVCNEAV
jgi:hypothetical protein